VGKQYERKNMRGRTADKGRKSYILSNHKLLNFSSKIFNWFVPVGHNDVL